MKVLFGSLKDISVDKIHKGIKSAFEKIKEELEEHLQTINENTNEIASQYEYICQLEQKIETLTERVDELQLMVYGKVKMSQGIGVSEIKQLTKDEQNVYVALSMLQEERGSVLYSDIAAWLRMAVPEIAVHIDALIQKKVPLLKRYINGKPYITIDADFKTMQAKENILQVEH